MGAGRPLRRVEADHTARSISATRIARLHPASTTHRQMSPEQQRMAGVLPRPSGFSIGSSMSATSSRISTGWRRPATASALEAANNRRGRHDRPGWKNVRLIVSPGLAPAQLREQDKFGCTQNARCGLTIGLATNMPEAGLQATEASSCACSDMPPEIPHRSPLASRASVHLRKRPNGGSTGNTPTSPISAGCSSTD